MDETVLFATTGIRGSSESYLNPSFCTKVGRAIAKHLQSSKPFLIAKDSRLSSDMIMHSLASGLAFGGVEVEILTTPVPTPLLVHTVTKNDFSGGVIVTGSHLPPSDNGIILINEDGSYFKGVLTVPSGYTPWSSMGTICVSTRQDDFIRNYKEHLLESLGDTKLGGKALIDAVHGPMRPYIRLVAEKVFDEVVAMNDTDDYRIPGRPSEPKPETLHKTREKLLEERCDLAICTDYDGDRVIFITGTGRVVSGDEIGGIFANNVWTEFPGRPVVIPINTSAILNSLSGSDKPLKYTKVGAPSIIEGIIEVDARFGFEETGKYFFSPDSLYPDSAYSTIQLCKIMATERENLDGLLTQIPKFYSLKTKLPSPRSSAPPVFARIRNDIQLFVKAVDQGEVESVETLDGIRVNFRNNSWFLIRQSGTEDSLRVFTDSTDEERTEKMNEILRNILEEKYLKT